MAQEVPTDNCDFCNEDYDLTKENARLNLYLRTSECNHIQAKCPNCDGEARIYVILGVACGLLKYLPIYVFADAPKDIQAGWTSLNGNAIPDIIASEYEIPPSLEKEIRRLHDALNDPNFTDEMELPQPPSKLPPKWRGDDNRPGASA